MSYHQSYGRSMSATDKLFGQSTLAHGQASVIKQTYVYLCMSIIAMMVGGYIGVTTPFIRGLFSGWIGWILALVLLNAIPYIAIAMRHAGPLGLIALLFDGLLSGIIIAPLLALAQMAAPGIILSAAIVTGIVFFSITGYVMTTKRVFSAPRGLMVGIFFTIIGVVILNMFLHMTFLSLVISAAIGIYGVFVLIYATSDVLHNPEADSPIPGALMLFAGLFNVFVSVLRILLIFASDD